MKILMVGIIIILLISIIKDCGTALDKEYDFQQKIINQTRGIE